MSENRSRKRALRVGASLVALSLVAGAAADEPKTDEAPKLNIAESDGLEPEEVARRFLVGIVTKDKQAIQRYMIPEKDAELLWAGQPWGDKTREKAGRQLSAIPFRRLKVGDVVVSADGKKYSVTLEQVAPGRLLLLPEGFTFPFALVHRPEGWRVKATSLIAARREPITEPSEAQKDSQGAGRSSDKEPR